MALLPGYNLFYALASGFKSQTRYGFIREAMTNEEFVTGLLSSRQIERLDLH